MKNHKKRRRPNKDSRIKNDRETRRKDISNKEVRTEINKLNTYKRRKVIKGISTSLQKAHKDL